MDILLFIFFVFSVALCDLLTKVQWKPSLCSYFSHLFCYFFYPQVLQSQQMEVPMHWNWPQQKTFHPPPITKRLHLNLAWQISSKICQTHDNANRNTKPVKYNYFYSMWRMEKSGTGPLGRAQSPKQFKNFNNLGDKSFKKFCKMFMIFSILLKIMWWPFSACDYFYTDVLTIFIHSCLQAG